MDFQQKKERCWAAIIVSKVGVPARIARNTLNAFLLRAGAANASDWAAHND